MKSLTVVVLAMILARCGNIRLAIIFAEKQRDTDLQSIANEQILNASS